MPDLCFELAEAPIGQHLFLQHCSSGSKRRGAGWEVMSSSGQSVAMPAAPRQATPHGASQLNKRLHAVRSSQHLAEPSTSSSPDTEAGPSQGFGGVLSAVKHHVPRLAAAVGDMLQPQGDTFNDHCVDQRVVNILTCAPFFAVGAHMLRRHKTPEGRNYAYSMLAVGGAATAYHISSGMPRRVFRKLDYYSIAVSSVFMMKALWPQKTWLKHGLRFTTLAIPFKPFVVSTAHTLAMQAEFARQAAKHKSIRPHFKLHTAAAAASAVAFALEDVLLERGFGHVHGIWHCLAAFGVATTGALVEHKEQLRLGLAAGGKGPGKTGMNLACHDSVGSLESLGVMKLKAEL